MTRAPDTLRLLHEAFPGRDRLVEQAYRDNRSFRELCNDYRRCAAALERWNRLEAKRSDPRREEYGELLEGLRGEIQTWLEAMDLGSYSTRDRPP